MNAKYLCIIALSLTACEKRTEGPYTTGEPAPRHEDPIVINKDEPKGGGPVATNGEREKARDRLATARCDHYKQCGDIAKDKKYDTIDSCLTREKAAIDKDWSLDDCPRIDTPRLEACLSAVTAKKCDGLFSTSPSECADSKVCIKP